MSRRIRSGLCSPPWSSFLAAVFAIVGCGDPQFVADVSVDAPVRIGGIPETLPMPETVSTRIDSTPAPDEDAFDVNCTVELVEFDGDLVGPGGVEFIELAVSSATPDLCGVHTIEVWVAARDECILHHELYLSLSPIEAGARWVIGTSAVVEADQVVEVDDLVPNVAAGAISLVDLHGDVVAAYGFGECPLLDACVNELGEMDPCLPADIGGPGQGVSACADGFLALRPITPGAPNHCPCAQDCDGQASVCQTGTCVDGICAFVSAPEGAKCNDGDLCTEKDRCSSGRCVGVAVECDAPPDPCAGGGECEPSTGACIYANGCGEHAECEQGPLGQRCVCEPGFVQSLGACTDIDECAKALHLCDPEAACANTPGGYTCTCPDGTFGDGFSCSPICQAGCEWAPDDCQPMTAILEVVPLDIWGQPLVEPNVSLTDSGGTEVPIEGTLFLSTDLCGPTVLTLTVAASEHHSGTFDLYYDGSALPTGLLESEVVGVEPVAYVLSEEVRWIGGLPVQHYTMWVGLPHAWYAASGRPARHGNLVEFLMDGEEVWASIWWDLLLAEEEVLTQTWWWTSELELIRDPGVHPYLPPDFRWEDTVMGVLEDMGVEGIEIKVLVNQFFSEEGLLSNVTVDSELLEKATTPGDGFEFLGITNPMAGQFTVVPAAVDFEGRLTEAWPELAAQTVVWSQGLPPSQPPLQVDMSDLPLGLSLVDIPHASWHQKSLTVDQQVTYVNGMNTKTTDWDTSDHGVFEYRRMKFDASTSERLAVMDKQAKPDFASRKDVSLRIEGPAVADVTDVFHLAWNQQMFSGVPYADLATGFAVQPPADPNPNGIQMQVVATSPPPLGELSILETILRAIGRAEELIFIEDQYFRAPLIRDAIIGQMLAEPDLVLIVVTNAIDEWVDPGCWQTYQADETFRLLFPTRYRLYTLQSFDAVDTGCVVCFDEVEGHFEPVFIHTKLFLVDDEYALIGSANHNNRGFLYEAELSVAIHNPPFVEAVRHEVLGNMLGAWWYAWPFAPAELIGLLDAAAGWNQWTLENWEWEGFDLDLDGDPLPEDFVPDGMVYPNPMGAPGDCLFENVGGDVAWRPVAPHRRVT